MKRHHTRGAQNLIVVDTARRCLSGAPDIGLLQALQKKRRTRGAQNLVPNEDERRCYGGSPDMGVRALEVERRMLGGGPINRMLSTIEPRRTGSPRRSTI